MNRCFSFPLSILYIFLQAATLPSAHAAPPDPQRRGTVYIETPGDTGSGAIVGRDGSVYLIVTNKHVVNAVNSGEEVVVGFYNGERVATSGPNIKNSSHYDISFIEASARGCMGIFLLSEIDNESRIWRQGYVSSPLSLGDEISVTGYSSVDSDISDIPVYRFSTGNVAAIIEYGKNGYQLGYTAPTARGMSGGPIARYYRAYVPVFYGIHGRGEADGLRSFQKTGMNFGIPSRLIKKEALSLGLSKYLKPSYSNYQNVFGQLTLRESCD